MVQISVLKENLKNGEYTQRLAKLYGDKVLEQPSRYIQTIENFEELFPQNEVMILSAPGRTEVGGNHTDHNNGKVLAASVNLDAVGVASPNTDNVIRLKSRGYQMITVHLDDLSIQRHETGKSSSLVRGIAARFNELGYKIGGFDATTDSTVLSGSGLSSSAAFEVLVCTILNHLYNDNKMNAVTVAKISQWSENVYFGKPCGLLDQMASSVGGFVTMDFEDTNKPIINPVKFDFSTSGHTLCIVDTGGDHAGLTDEYTAVRSEMEDVAAVFEKRVLRELERDEFIKNIARVRNVAGDRATLRALHFYNENDRVNKEVQALENNDFETFKQLIIESGHSSFMYNQNVYAKVATRDQAVALGLAVSECILWGKGAWRVHGGGFAGTIQAFVPNDMVQTYKNAMKNIFGKDCFYELIVRPEGGTRVI